MGSVREEALDDSHLERLRLALRAVVPDEEESACPLVRVRVARVHPRQCQKVLKTLSSSHPLESELRHVRRVRQIAAHEVLEANAHLRAPASPSSSSPSRSSSAAASELWIVLVRESAWSMEQDAVVQAIGADTLLRVTHADVPAVPPPTREHMEDWAVYWPTSYKGGGATRVNPADLTEDELVDIQKYMRRAIATGKSLRNEYAHCVGAVIVDPSRGEIVADGSYGYGGGKAMNPMQTAIMQSIANVGIANAHTNRKSTDSGQGERVAYLCTNLHCYVTHEPNIMDAMALLHSRIARVVYAVPNPSFGGLGGRVKLNVDRRLNHRFDVFSGALRDEASVLDDA